MRRLKVAAGTAVALALAVAGCSSPSTTTPGGQTTATIGTQSNALDPNAKGPAADIAGAQKGGTITVYSESTPSTFDPTAIYYTDTSEIGKLLFRTPTEFDIRNGKPTLVPDLTDLGTVSSDNLTWTFKMKPGLKYQDGSEIKVDDLAYAIKRSFAHDLYADGPTYQLTYFKDGDTYKGPYTSGLTCGCVETSGTDTLIIHLAKPFSDLPFYMSFPMFSPIPADKDTKENYKNAPIATGPYQFASYTPGSELKLVKNTNWDANSDPVRHQYVDGWDFKWGLSDIKTQQQVLNSAGPDADAINYGNVDAQFVPALTGPKASQLVQGDSPCTLVVNLDSRKIPDINVRKAIAKAYPYDQIYTAAGQNSLISEKASTIMPPSVPGYTKYTPYPDLTGSGQGDPAGAKAILTTAGKVGFELSWYYDNTSQISQQTTQIRTDAFKAAGFTVKPIGVTTAELRAKLGDTNAPVNLGQAPSGWCSDWPSGGSWFPVLFESHSIADGLSWGFQSDATLDKQIDDIASLPAADATAKWGALDQQIMGLYIVLPRYYDKMAIVEGTNVGGTVGDGTMGMPFFVNMFLKSPTS